MTKRVLIAIVIAAAVLLPITAYCADEKASLGSSGESIYSYNENDLPAVFFFPPEKARWNGYAVTMREWYMLTELQKEKFISEYTEELKKQYKTGFEVILRDYLSALDAFSYYANEKAAGEPSTKFVEKILRGQGKI